MSGITRISVLKRELSKLGYTFVDVSVNRIAYTRFTSPRGVGWLYRNDGGTFPMPYASASYILMNKTQSMNYLQSRGFRVPRSMEAQKDGTTIAQYRAALHLRPDAQLVVKPVDGTLSQGVSTRISSQSQLDDALRASRRYSPTAIVQEQFEGEEYRFSFIGGVLRSIIYKQKPLLIGDGTHTIRTLIKEENRERAELQLETVTYPALKEADAEAFGVDLERVPAFNEVVYLSESTMIEDGASMYELLGDVHPSYVALAESMAQDFGPGYLAVDLLIKDRFTPATRPGYCFLEFNNLPAMMLFYTCRNGQKTDVGRDLAHYIDKILHVHLA